MSSPDILNTICPKKVCKSRVFFIEVCLGSEKLHSLVWLHCLVCISQESGTTFVHFKGFPVKVDPRSAASGRQDIDPTPSSKDFKGFPLEKAAIAETHRQEVCISDELDSLSCTTIEKYTHPRNRSYGESSVDVCMCVYMGICVCTCVCVC